MRLSRLPPLHFWYVGVPLIYGLPPGRIKMLKKLPISAVKYANKFDFKLPIRIIEIAPLFTWEFLHPRPIKREKIFVGN